MIKFFRKIRQNLLSEGNTGKYLKYAIGEIVLVVIGILIALWINNWNQERIISMETNELLSNMITDLKTDIERFDLDIGRLEESVAGGEFILQTKNFESISADSLYNQLPFKVIFYKFRNQSYELLKNIGVTNILDSNELYNKITEYYTFDSLLFEALVDLDSKESNEMISYFSLDNVFEAPNHPYKKFISYSENETFRKKALLKLVTGIKSRNHIRQGLLAKTSVIITIKFLKTKAESLISSIEDELNKK